MALCVCEILQVLQLKIAKRRWRFCFAFAGIDCNGDDYETRLLDRRCCGGCRRNGAALSLRGFSKPDFCTAFACQRERLGASEAAVLADAWSGGRAVCACALPHSPVERFSDGTAGDACFPARCILRTAGNRRARSGCGYWFVLSYDVRRILSGCTAGALGTCAACDRHFADACHAIWREPGSVHLRCAAFRAVSTPDAA